MRAELAQVPAELIDPVWPSAEPYLRRAYDKMGYDYPPTIYERIKSGKADLWLAYVAGHLRAVCVTSVHGHTFNIEALAGEGMTEWFDLIEDLEDMARRYGQKAVVKVDGRKGWQEPLQKRGYRVERVVMRKEL